MVGAVKKVNFGSDIDFVVMEKKINVENFCIGADRLLKIKSADNNENKPLIDYIKAHIIKEYVSYVDKCNYATRIIRATSYMNINDDSKVFRQDSTSRYVLHCLALIDLYTDIEIDYSNNIIQDFDMLEQRGLIAQIIAQISDVEVNRFDMIMSMKYEDLMENERSVNSMIQDAMTSINKVLKKIGDNIASSFESAGITAGDLVNYINNL